jgi:hypothetical protein
LTNDIQKQLIQRLGELTGKPKSSGLHIHPILNSERELGGNDPEISTISSLQHNKFYKKATAEELSPKKQNTASWHSDIAFEPVPADYSSLRLVQLPKTGGGMKFTVFTKSHANKFKTLFGHPDMRSMIALVSHISVSLRLLQQLSPNPYSAISHRNLGSSCMINQEVPRRI